MKVEPTKELLEIALIRLKQTPFIHQVTAIEAAIEEWMLRVKIEEQFQGIIRHTIPFTAVLVPDTPQTSNFLELALSIRETAKLQAPPQNENQMYWLKTMQYYWQAKGLVLAYKLFGVIENPLREGGVLSRRLPPTSIKNLKLSTDIDLACYHLLVKGESYIKDWAKKQNIKYPFNSPMELFLEILKEEFQTLWLLGPLSPEYKWLDKKTQRDNINVRIHLINHDDWRDPPPQKNKFSPPKSTRLSYKETEQQYLKFLREIGWSGYWILALREQNHQGPLDHLWKAYLKAFKKGKELFIHEFDWRNGQPYKAFRTSRTRAVEAIIDNLGYIRWVWSSSI